MLLPALATLSVTRHRRSHSDRTDARAALANARLAVGRLGVEILLTQLPQGRQRLGQWRLGGVLAQLAPDPALEPIELFDQRPDGGGFLRRVAPFDVERRLDAGAP